MQLHDKYKGRGVVFIGLTPDGGEDAIQATTEKIEQFGISWPNAYGATQAIQSLGVTGFPTKIVVDASGKVSWHDELGGELEAAIEAALSAL